VRAFAPLSEPIVARLWGAMAIFTTGDEVFRVALIWLAVETVGRNVGYMGALQSGAMLIGAMFGGALAAFLDQKRALTIYCLFGAVCTTVPFLVWQFGTPAFAALAFTAMGVASLRAQIEPTVQGNLPLLVKNRDVLFATNALLEGTRRLARVTGPMIAAALALVIAVHHIFLIHMLALIAAGWLLLAVGARFPDREPREAGGFTLGLKILRDEPVLKRLLAIKSVTDAVWVIAIAHAFPVVVEASGAKWSPFGFDVSGVAAYGLGIAVYGVANSCSTVAVGALPATLSLRRMMCGSTVMCMGLTTMAAAPLLAPPDQVLQYFYVALAFCALGSPFFDIPLAFHVQMAGGPAAPRAAASSVHRVRLVTAFGGIMIAGLISPGLFAAFGPGHTMLASGLIGLATCAVGFRVLAPYSQRSTI
jgi:MFS transporter, DHA3 family, macrolide efflux protein